MGMKQKNTKRIKTSKESNQNVCLYLERKEKKCAVGLVSCEISLCV